MLPTKFQLIWPNGFREHFYLIGQSQTRIAYGSHISCMISTKYENFVQDLPYIIPTKKQFIVHPSFLYFCQSEIRIAHGIHVFCKIRMK